MKLIKNKAQKRIAKSLNEIVGAAFEDTKKDTVELKNLIRNVCNICVDCKLDPSMVIPCEVSSVPKQQKPKQTRSTKREGA